jgi:regulatory protein
MRFTNVPSKRIGNKKILSIAVDKKGLHLVSFTDGSKLRLDDDAFTEIPLYEGKEVTELEYRQLTSFLKNEGLASYALSLALKGCYSRHDVRLKLEAKSQDADQIRQALYKVQQEGFLDDEAFAKQYVEEKENQLYGEERILSDLRFKHGINETIISRLHFDKEEENAKKAALQLEKRYARLPLRAKQQKGSEALRRRGYRESIASWAVSSYQEDKESSVKALADLSEKLIARYEKKYNGYELRAKCFAALLAKGYRSEDIARILEEKL